MQLNQAGTYNATIKWPSNLELMFHTSSRGSDGLLLDLVTSEGDTIQHIVWLTAKTYDKAVETLGKVFGFDGDFKALAGGRKFPRNACSIVTEMEAFTKDNGSTINTCKVKWLNAPTGVVGGGDVASVLQRLRSFSSEPIADINRRNAEKTISQELEEADTIPF